MAETNNQQQTEYLYPGQDPEFMRQYNALSNGPTDNFQETQGQKLAQQWYDAKGKRDIGKMQEGLIGQAKQFEQDIPQMKQDVLKASDAATAGKLQQEQRMTRSQAVARGQIGGQAKLRMANLSAGARYAHIAASVEIENKLKAQSMTMQQEAIDKSQALAGMSLENAQREYDLQAQQAAQSRAALGSLGQAVGMGVGTYFGSQKDPNAGKESMSYQAPQNQVPRSDYGLVYGNPASSGFGEVKK